MNFNLVKSGFVFLIFQLGWICLISLVINNDVSDLQARKATWRSALLATTPRLLMDGNLVRLEALLRTESDLPTVLCTLNGKTLVSNELSGSEDLCASQRPAADEMLIFDSKPVGRLRVMESSPFSPKGGKYVLLLLIWGMATFLYYSVRRRHSDLRIIDGLLDYMKAGDDQSMAHKARHFLPSGSKMEKLVQAVTGYREAREKLNQAELDLEKSRLSAELAAQVSHDIRSPLATLNAAIQSTLGPDESTRVQIRTALNRIRDIANGLLAKNREAQAGTSVLASKSAVSSIKPHSSELLPTLIDSAVSQKRLQFSDRPEIVITFEVSPDCLAIFSEIQPGELHRVISNLVNNSVEALERPGQIQIALTRQQNLAILTIRDNGKGIPRELLAKVLDRGGTFGKVSGNGLGLSHAKSMIESWGGKLLLESAIDEGTTVQLELPIAEPPRWFPSEIRIQVGMTVVVIDDDPLMHGIWDQRLSAAKEWAPIIHLHSPQDLLEWYRNHLHTENILFLCDYEFSEHQITGLDVLDMTCSGSQAILITNLWEEDKIRRRCEKQGIKLLPKPYAETVPLTFDMEIRVQ